MPSPATAAAASMERSLGWQRAMMDLAGDDEGWRAQLTEVCGWFPSTEMLVNHARGLVKVLTDAERKRAFPYGRGVPPVVLLV